MFQELSPGAENYHVLRLAPRSLSRMSRHVNHHVPLTRFDVNCEASCVKWTWRDNGVKTWDIRHGCEGDIKGWNHEISGLAVRGILVGEKIGYQAWLWGGNQWVKTWDIRPGCEGNIKGWKHGISDLVVRGILRGVNMRYQVLLWSGH